LKIAFIGTHGVGKTTLAYDLAARLKRLDLALDLVKEVARDCPLPINRDTTFSAQAWILHTQIARELAAEAVNEVVICDRSVLDNYAYLVHKLGRMPGLDPLVKGWLETYTLLVKVPIWTSLRADGVRDTETAFQHGVDETLDELIAGFGAEVLLLPAEEEPDRWADRVVEALSLPDRARQETLFPE
jgi:nicotinamide riboside kinase